MLEIASSLPVLGEPLPAAWSERGSAGVEVRRVGVPEALAVAGLPASLARRLPAGYVVASAELSMMGSALESVTFSLRQPDTDAAGEPLTLHVERGTRLPAPSSSEQSEVVFAGVEGRWTPSRSELEWVDQGVYHSLQGEAGLGALIDIASALARIETGIVG